MFGPACFAALLLLTAATKQCNPDVCRCVGACSYCRQNGVTFLCLQGELSSMGYYYGQVLQKQLQDSLQMLRDHYRLVQNSSFSEMERKAKEFQSRYSYTFTNFLQGMAAGANLSFSEVTVLNGMETLADLSPGSGALHSGCTFAFVPPKFSSTGGALLARNYDFAGVFSNISRNLVLTILKQTDRLPVALIGMPGQVYCPSCLNFQGLFVELNNGGPSGGFAVDQARKSMLINMLEFSQNAAGLDHLWREFEAAQTDYSLIVNTASNQTVKSFEFSSVHGMRTFRPENDSFFVSTNYFLNETWQNIQNPTDATTWSGVTRRDNMLNLLRSRATTGKISFDALKNVMDVTISEGGAKVRTTIYQIVFDPGNLRLGIRPRTASDWFEIDLKYANSILNY